MCVVYLCFDFGEFYIFPGLLEGGKAGRGGGGKAGRGKGRKQQVVIKLC